MIITNNRSLSRLAAVQTLFQYDFNARMQLHELKNINDKEISEIFSTKPLSRRIVAIPVLKFE